MAIHQELGNEQFIGALYSETLSDNAETLIASNQSMRMELKIVTADGMPTRRFSRMWIEGMAINNSSSLLTAQADNMVKFDGLFKGWLRERDHIVFAKTPGEGIDISVNNVLLGNIADERFFEMLLRTWIGRVPLSSTYRDNLLKVGNVPSSLRSRYEGLSFNPARTAEIAAWATPVAEVPAPAPVAATPAPQPAPAQARPPVEVAAAPAPALAAPRLELPALEQPTSPAATPPPAPVEPQPQAVPEPARVATARPVIEEEEDNEPVLTAQSLLARQFYVSDILKRINSNTQYPRRAQERNQEGGTRIAVTIDRSGNVRNMSWLEESKHNLLNKAAWDAVERSAPFPAMPAALTGQVFEFTVPITFEMQD